jgi:hypothetical protein
MKSDHVEGAGGGTPIRLVSVVVIVVDSHVRFFKA